MLSLFEFVSVCCFCLHVRATSEPLRAQFFKPVRLGFDALPQVEHNAGSLRLAGAPFAQATNQMVSICFNVSRFALTERVLNCFSNNLTPNIQWSTPGAYLEPSSIWKNKRGMSFAMTAGCLGCSWALSSHREGICLSCVEVACEPHR